MAAAKKGNQMRSADDIDWCVTHINCCQWQFMNHFLRIRNCSHGIVTSYIDHLVKPYSPSSVEIGASTCAVTTDGGKLLLIHNVK